MINQAATHHFLPARIQGAGREREGGGAGPSPRPLQAPGRGRARRAPPSLAWPPPARPARSGGPGGGCERCRPRGFSEAGRRRGRPEPGSRGRGGRRRGRAARVSAQVGAGGAVWTAPGGARGGRAGCLPGPSTAGGARLGSCRSERSLSVLIQAISDLPSNPLPLCSFPCKVWGYARAYHFCSRPPYR